MTLLGVGATPHPSRPEPSINLGKARDPLVLALDIGSSAGRARIYDAEGRRVRGLRHRIPHAITTRADGTAVLDAEEAVRRVEALITHVLAAGKTGGRIAGVVMDTIASSLVGVDADVTALTPCYTYADARPSAQVEQLRAELDEEEIRQRTGCYFHSSYLPARLRWLRENEPETVVRVARWLSLGEYVYARLLGRHAVSYSTAAWTGLLDRRDGAWDAALIDACGADPVQFSPIHDTAAPLESTGGDLAGRWPGLAGAAWFPAVTDGYASNYGCGATEPSTLALAAGTSGALRVLMEGAPEQVPSGLWCYRVDRQRSLLGGALNDVGRVLAWLRDRLRLPDDAALNDALLAPPSPLTPAVLPFLTGERSPGWAAGARAAFAEISETTTALNLFRGAMEGVALRYALVTGRLAEAVPTIERVVAGGGVADDWPGWLQVAADALGRPVTRVAEKQATLRGTALLALDVLAPEAPRTPAALAETYAPWPDHAAYYREAATRQEKLYAALVTGKRRKR